MVLKGKYTYNSMATSYFDFSDLGVTLDNATYEMVERVVSLGPTWLKVLILFIIFGAIAFLINRGVRTVAEWFDMKKLMKVGK